MHSVRFLIAGYPFIFCHPLPMHLEPELFFPTNSLLILSSSAVWPYHIGVTLVIYLEVMLATGLGNPPAVWFLARSSVRSGCRPGQKPHQMCLCGFVTRTGNEPAGFLPGSNRTAAPALWFLNLGHQISIWVLIVLWHDQYVDCAVLLALSPPVFRFAIRLTFVEWLWRNGKLQAKFAGFQ